MNVDRPHDIIDALELEKKTERDRARYVPLTQEEAALLRGLSEEERADWIKANMPTKERLSRHLRSIGLTVLASRAATGEFSDFEGPHATPKVVLLQELLKAQEKAKRAKGEHHPKVFAIHDLAQLIKDGQYDDTKAESDAWAAKQTGEVAETLDKLGLR